MATLSSNNVTLKKPIPGFGAGGGQIRTQYDWIDLPAVVTTSDLINFGSLPAHAIVHGVRIKNAALGGGTLQLGDLGGFDDAGVAIAAAPARYSAAYAVTSASSANTLAQAGIFFYTGSRPIQLQATLATGPTTTAGRLEVSITYTVEEPQGRP